LQVLSTSNAPELSEDDRRHLRHVGDTALTRHAVPGTVQLILAEDEYVHSLNATYRSVDAPTDVLSFAYGDGQAVEFAVPGDWDGSGGEVYISLDRARLQAAELEVATIQELGRLLVHGLLHLAGYDHQTPEDLERMERETDCILEVAGRISRPGGRTNSKGE